MKTVETPETSSPAWQPGTRMVAGVLLILLSIFILYELRQLLAPLVLGFLLAYLLHPIVAGIRRRTRASRGLAVLLVYIVLLLIFVGTTTGLGVAVSQRMTRFAVYLGDLSNQLPAQIEALANLVITIGPWQIDLSQINLEPVLSELAAAVRPLLSQTGSLLASVAMATASAVTVAFLVMILGYYLLLDFSTWDDHFLSLVPEAYRGDAQRLLSESSQLWNAFLRGQAILALIIGSVTSLLLTILGVRFSLVLGIIAGLMEFIPLFGPIIAALLSVLVALFQGSNWWGLSQLVYGLIVIAVFVILQQVENNILVPRIIGRSLNLHPLTVLLAVLAGGMLAGVIGLLLAAPIVASLRLWLGYVYRKTVGLETWPSINLIIPASRRERGRIFKQFLSCWRGIRTRLSRKDLDSEV
jgi:predicted PurR-regulated permease PerM